MKYKNSFFRIDIRDDATYLVLYPPLNDGKKLEIKEILDYLDSKSIKIYSVNELKNALETLTEVTAIYLTNEKVCQINEEAKVIISPDKMIAFVRFYPPAKNGKMLSKNEIISELSRCGVKYGIAGKIIDVFFTARQYCLDIPLAKGEKAIPAKDAYIEYYFNTKPLSKPSVLEDGSVDFHQLNLFTKVAKDDLLAKLISPQMGKPGTNIFGETVSTNTPKNKLLKYGRNIRKSDDGLEIYSMVDGDVTLTEGTVFVSDTYTVVADVDASTGDLDYEGNILIKGNVRTGFTVKSKGDIQINGVVEGANVIAGGNIVIKRGVQGMNKGYLEAGGDICANFFESATVKSKGAINVGSILHSKVNAGDKVIVSGRKGFIIGGEICSELAVEVNNIGNKVETSTIIKIGVKPELYDEMKKIMVLVNEINEEAEEVSSYLNVFKKKIASGVKLSPENIKSIKEYNTRLESLNNDKKEHHSKLIQLKEEIDTGKKGYIKLYGNLFVGVTIMIASRTFVVKEIESHSIYKLLEGDIKRVVF